MSQLQRCVRGVVRGVAGALLGGAALAGCDESGVVSQIRLQLNMLSDTANPNAPIALPAQGEVVLTPYYVENERGEPEGMLYESTTLDLSTRSGGLSSPMRLGKWRVVAQSGAGAPFPFFGVSGVFEVKDRQAFIQHMFVGREHCTGLMPSVTPPTNRALGNEGTLDIPRGAAGAAAVEVSPGRVLVIGGGTLDEAGRLRSVSSALYLYDHAYGLVFPTGVTLGTARAYHTATQLPDGRVLVAGGVASVGADGAPVPTGSAELISVDGGGAVTVVAAGVGLATPRSHHTAALLKDGTVLVAGGLDAQRAPLKSAARFYPTDANALGGFRAQGDMAAARAFHAMSTLDRTNEQAVVLGGFTEAGPTAAVEMFSVSGGGCTPPAAGEGCFVGGWSLQNPRWGHVALPTAAKKSTVVVAGGFSAGTVAAPAGLLAPIEAFTTERSTNAAGEVREVPTSVSLGALPEPRAFASGVRLRDDTLLLAGGQDAAGNALAAVTSLRAFVANQGGVDTLTVAVARTCPLSEPRVGVGAVGMRDGGAMWMGGVVAGMTRAESGRVELYYPATPALKDLQLD